MKNVFLITLIALTSLNVAWGQTPSATTSVVSVSPPVIPTNGTTTITVQLKEANGTNITSGSTAVSFVSPSSGSIGTVTNNQDGTYTAIYTAGTTTGNVSIIPVVNSTNFSNTAQVTVGSSYILDGTSGNNTEIHSFSTNGNITIGQGFFVDYLIVGGGGGGGSTRGGGGGAGGVLQGNNYQLNLNSNGSPSLTSNTVSVGSGGAANQKGGNSTALGITSEGGGGGGRPNDPSTGGSGGGGAGFESMTGANGTSGQGNNGGNGSQNAGAGGGGAGQSGQNAVSQMEGGKGGDGISSSITGAPTFYAGGGGGMSESGINRVGGLGGGGIGANSLSGTNNSTDGAANTGGGGGGGNNSATTTGRNGGSGVVHIRYKGNSPNEGIISSITPNKLTSIGGFDYQLYSFLQTGSTPFNLSNAVVGTSVSNPITGSGNLTYSGPGRLTLEANNTYSGSTTISGGTLQIGNGGTTGTFGTGTITNNATLVFNRSNAYTLGTGNAISGNGTVEQIGSGTLDLGGITSHSAGTWILRNGSITNGTISGNFTLESGNVSAILGGSGNLTKNTGGTVTLSTNNTYSGTTTVNAGTLIVNGTHSGSGAVTVNSGANLKGTGSLSGTTTINSGATVEGGNSIGTLGFDNLTLAGGGNYNWQIDDATGTAGTNWDQLNVSGTLDITATSSNTFNINVWTLLANGTNGALANFNPTESLYTWTIITAGSITGFSADKFQINTDPTNGTGGLISPYQVDGFTVLQQGNTIVLQYDPPAAQTIDGTNNGSETANYTTSNTAGSLTLDLGFFADYLIVGGGGGGGIIRGGGGGGGAVIERSQTKFNPLNFTVTVGNGGAGSIRNTETNAENGQSSSIFGVATAIGGGAGGRYANSTQGSSGGGGGGFSQTFGAAGINGIGFPGGNGSNLAGAGGGGAGGPGANANGTAGGVGGIGKSSSISGTLFFYGAGGGGMGDNGINAPGGNSVGGQGASNLSGTSDRGNGMANTGSGGGGGNFSSGGGNTGGTGGSGVVIIRYQGDALSNVGGTVTSFTGNGTNGLNGVPYQVHTFTSSGNFNLSNVDFNARLKATLAGNIIGTGDLIYDSQGQLTLTGANHTYSGATEIKNGELRVNSNISSSSGVTVDAGATLSGTGTLPATIINGTHNPGNSPGLQTFNGDLTYGANATLNWELATNSVGTRGTDFDAINVTGNLNFAGATTLNLIFDGSGSAVDWSDNFWDNPALGTNGWKIFEVSGLISNLNNLSINVVNWVDGQNQTYSSQQGVAIPSFKLVKSGNGVYLTYEPLLPSLTTSTVTASPNGIVINGTSTLTVQLKDQNGNNFPNSGGTITFATTLGSVGTVTNNNDGTYTATFTAGSTIGTATVTASLNSNAIAQTEDITIVVSPLVLPGGRNVGFPYTENINTGSGVLFGQGFGAQYLVVAGGGGGGGSGPERAAGGGGAGGFLEGYQILSTQGYTATAGGGGGGGSAGNRGGTGANSVFGSITASGGGGGGGITINSNQSPNNGGSGGGHISTVGNAFGSGASGQGNNGAPGMPSGDINQQWGGGGGGAGSAGGILEDGTTTANRNGGFGKQSDITGTLLWYAGGGGGGKRTSGTGGSGRAGGGHGGAGNGNGGAAAGNSGSGGGGAGSVSASASGGAGGSGIVAVRYPGASVVTSGPGTASTITVNGNSWTLHRYLSGSTTMQVNLSAVNPNTFVTEVSGIISGSGPISYNAPGTLTLSGANTFTGPFSIENGTVNVIADHSGATGAITVKSGATLKGATTFGGNVTAKSGSVLAPGNSAGLMTFAEDLILEEGSTFKWELFNNAADASLRGSDYDAVNVQGTLSIGSNALAELAFNGVGSQVDFTDAFWLTDHSWVVFEGASIPAASGAVFGTVNITADASSNTLTSQPGLTNAQFFWTVEGNNVVLNYWSGAPSALTSTVTASPDNIKADGISTSTLLIQLKDAQGNNITYSYGPLTVSTPSNGALSAVTDNNNGTYTTTYTAGLVKGQVSILPQVKGVNFTNGATIELKTSGVIPAAVGGLASNEDYELDEDLTLSLGFGVEYLVVGGGGGGGGAAERAGGGGGGGGVLFGTLAVSDLITYTYQVGSGGSGGTGRQRGQNGGNSFFGTNIVSLTATGGGGGAGLDIFGAVAPTSGGSGGGGTSIGGIGGLGSIGQGFNGAQGIASGDINAQWGGGGGGAGASPLTTARQNGGAGVLINFNGTARAYGGGGGGGKRTSGTPGQGILNVSGDGGANANGSPGAANTGGGGGGAGSAAQSAPRTGGLGASGLVAIRYKGTTSYTAGSSGVTVNGESYRLNTFSSNNGSLNFDFTNLDQSTLSAIADGVISGSHNITYDHPGTLILNETNTYIGTTTISSGTLQIGNNGTSGSLGVGAVINNGSLKFKRTDNISFEQAISGSGQLIKDGSGRLELTTAGSQTYTGQTIIENGELRVNSDLTNSSDILVKAGAVLSGTGNLPAIDVYGKHRPGNSPGVQRVQGSASYRKGSIIEWELSTNGIGHRGVDYDGIDVIGDLVFEKGAQLQLVFDDATSDVNWEDAYWTEGTPQRWKLFELTANSRVEGLTSLSTQMVSEWKDALGRHFETVHPDKEIQMQLIQEANGIYVELQVVEKAILLSENQMFK